VHNGCGTAEKIKILKIPALKIKLYFGRILFFFILFPSRPARGSGPAGAGPAGKDKPVLIYDS
tara:strand:- start:4449 stop:4637 length:189 start_codon:yes stop_codon:yes gene_type:complete